MSTIKRIGVTLLVLFDKRVTYVKRLRTTRWG